jgi:hypothetical protein
MVLVGIMRIEQAHEAEERPPICLRRIDECDRPVGRPLAHVQGLGMVELGAAVTLQRREEIGRSLAEPRRVAVEPALRRNRRIEAPFVDVEAVMGVPAILLLDPAADVELAEERRSIAGLPAQPLGKQQLVLGKVVMHPEHAMLGYRLAGKDAGPRRGTDRVVDCAILEHGAGLGQAVEIGRGYPVAAIGAERIPALLVRHDHQDVRQRQGMGPRHSMISGKAAVIRAPYIVANGAMWAAPLFNTAPRASGRRESRLSPRRSFPS